VSTASPVSEALCHPVREQCARGTQFDLLNELGSRVALLLPDLLWSVSSRAEVVIVISSLRSHVPAHVKVLVACAFDSTHVLFNCSAMSMFCSAFLCVAFAYDLVLALPSDS